MTATRLQAKYFKYFMDTLIPKKWKSKFTEYGDSDDYDELDDDSGIDVKDEL